MPSSTRAITGAAALAAALAASVLTAPAAFAAPAPTSATPSLSSFADWHQWVDPANYDYALVGGKLRMSNGLVNVNNYGNITQLSSPAIAEVGESSTGAGYRVFTADYTIDAATYDAQPGLAVEVAGDQGGNRSGGGVVFRQDDDDQLTLSTYWADAGSEADLEDWNNSTATIPFDGPVSIRYIVEYNNGAPDSVKVYADGALVLTGQGYEAYHEAVASPKQKIDSLLFRTSRNKPVLDGAWEVVTPTEEQRTALRASGGFLFSGISYGASNTAFAPSSTIGVAAKISGSPVVGATLTASAEVSTIGGATLSYQWQRAGLNISGATGATYTVGANDVNKRIAVKVTASKSGYTNGSSTVQTDPVSAATLTWSSAPAITGTAKLGSTLTANATTDPAAKYAYQWYRDGAAIKGAIAKTYKLGTSDVGRTITVKVTATKSGYATLAATSDPTATVAPGTLGNATVSLSGSAVVNGTLTATQKGWSTSLLIRYAFYANGDLVQYSTSKTYKPTFQDVGKRITVIASAAARGYDVKETPESASRGPVK